jgi:hypothetical protein
MVAKHLETEFSDEEIALRRDEVIKRMANTPPKPHSAMKLGKPPRAAFIKGKSRS